jgi:predicted DNA-binding protein (MmcQ/YjbR family)
MRSGMVAQIHCVRPPAILLLTEKKSTIQKQFEGPGVRPSRHMASRPWKKIHANGGQPLAT